MKKLDTYIKATALALLVNSASFAASLQVYPVNINFAAGENVKAIYVKNAGNAPISAQIRIYQWGQKDQDDVLSPTQSLIASPPITAIPAGQQQLIRVILPVPAATNQEQAYKLVVDELPGAGTSTERTVRFLLRYNLPVFINTPSAPIDLSQMKFHLDTRTLPAHLWIENNSDKHLKLSNVSLSSGKEKMVVTQGLLGYVLAHSSRSWVLPKGQYSGSTLTFNANDNSSLQTAPVITN